MSCARNGLWSRRLSPCASAVAVAILVAVVTIINVEAHISLPLSDAQRGFVAGCTVWSCDQPLVEEVHSAWPAPRPELRGAALQRWQALHLSHCKQARSTSTPNSHTVVFLGDSITEGWLRTGFSAGVASVPQPRCKKIWQEAFGRWRPLNFGIGGDRVQDLGWRLQHGLLPASLQPSAFVVHIGTNDIGNGERTDVTLVELRTLLSQLHTARPAAAVLVVGLFPRGGEIGTPRTARFHRHSWWVSAWNDHRTSVDAINRNLSAFVSSQLQHRPASSERGGPWRRPPLSPPHQRASVRRQWLHMLDCGEAFLARSDEPVAPLADDAAATDAALLGASPREFIDLEMMYDLLHLTPRGYRAWADCLVPALEAVLAHSGPQAGGASGAMANVHMSPVPPTAPPPCAVDGSRKLPSHVHHVHTTTPSAKLARVHVLLNTTDAAQHFLAGCHLDDVVPDTTSRTTGIPMTRVVLCNESASREDADSLRLRLASARLNRAPVALCIPPLYGSISAAGVQAHITHHRRLGVRRVYIYTTPALHCSSRHALAAIARGSRGTVVIFDLPWIADHDGMQSYHGNSGAQVWALNDCIHRSAADGHEWSLSLDIDEFLFLNGVRNISALLDVAEREHAEMENDSMQLEVLSFGSRESTEVLQIQALIPPDHPNSSSAWQMFHQPYCDHRPPPKHIKTDLCPGWHGHRKYLVRTRSSYLAFVHHVHKCWAWRRRALHAMPTTCEMNELNATRHAWIEHAAMRSISAHAAREPLRPPSPPSPPPPPSPSPPPPCIVDGIRKLPSHVHHVHTTTPAGMLARVHVLLNTTDAAQHFLAGCHLDDVVPDTTSRTTGIPMTRVVLCNESASREDADSLRLRLASARLNRAPVALCIPPLYGSISAAGVQAHITHHRRLGVRRVYIYTTPALHCSSRHALAAIARGSRGTVVIFDLPWIADHDGMQSYHGNSGAQVWALNDCIHRSAADGHEWSLSLDIDEFLFLNGVRNISALLDVAEREHAEMENDSMQLEVLSFGSRESTEVLQIQALIPPDHPNSSSAWQMFHQPYCDHRPPPKHIKTDLCPGWHGHRKYLVRTRSSYLAFVHHVHKCWAWRRRALHAMPTTCEMNELNATRHAWIEHATTLQMHQMNVESDR